ncbi:MAG: serine/threonine-protein kinase [Myxococcota bacterium]
MLEPGERIGDYEVIDLIGVGGMANVYRVRHAVLGSVYALKVLREPLIEVPEARERFLAEGRIQARVQHPNIVQVIGIVSVEGIAGLVMEFLDGPTLGERIADVDGPLPLPEVRAILSAVLIGVQVIHDAGIVHRDLKPDNIKLQPRSGGWRPVMFDFGVAHLSEEGEARVGHRRRLKTKAGKWMGTPGYMSPEQVEGGLKIDERTDIFALGCILYEMLSGRQAFHGPNTFTIMSRIAEGDYTPLVQVAPDTPPALLEIVERAMQVRPEQRFASAGAFAAAAEEAFVDIFSPAPPPEPEEIAPPPPTPTPTRGWPLDLMVLVLLAIACIGAVTGLGGWTVAQRRAADQDAASVMRQLQLIRTDAAASRDAERLKTVWATARAARAARETPATLGVEAIAQVWSQGWHLTGFSRQHVDAWLTSADALTKTAAEAGTGEGLLARALVTGVACARLPADDPRRASLCAEAPRRYEAAARTLRDDPRAWLRFEVFWSAAAFHNRLAEGWWASRQAAPAREEWRLVETLCDKGQTDLSAAPVQDLYLARECLLAAGGLGDYARYFQWSQWLRGHDEGRAGLTDWSISRIYQSAHPSCRRLPGGARSPWTPRPSSRRERFCQYAGLLALSCPQQAEDVRRRFLMSKPDPLVSSIRKSRLSDTRRCYLDDR